MTELQVLGFHSFTYSGIPYRIINDIHAPSDCRLFKLSHLKKNTSYLASTEDEFARHQAYLGKMRTSDLPSSIQQGFSQPYIMAADSREQMQGHPDSNFNSAINWPISSFCNPEWGMMFFLKSWRDADEMRVWYLNNMQLLGNLLFSYHLEFMLHHKNAFNPFLQMGVFKIKTLDVLRMAANGDSGKVISQELCMTPGGVDYHIEQMRIKLQAKNRVHLIKIANRLEII
ncbi:helix-turn-helix transcriptional regulator [Parendozoicomonas haliclonae]|nr:helix-turn-helix transcriptional regulator [Parendozoicomonas haliclonae]